MKIVHKIARRVRRLFNQNIYQTLYEEHAALHPEDTSVGAGDYDMLGQIELALLRQEGLLPHHTLVDFGCGNGRLAVHAIPYLSDGKYIGIDISSKLLNEAQKRIDSIATKSSCKVVWQVQTTPEFKVEAATVDMICAFSVFTHMEHEDSFNYLCSTLPIMKPNGKFIFSCLPLSMKGGRVEFLRQAKMDFSQRWTAVRNVATSVDMMSDIAKMAGWQVGRWYVGDENNINITAEKQAQLGQSSCVLEAVPK